MAKRGAAAVTGTDRGLSHRYLTLGNAWELVPGIDEAGNSIVVWSTVSSPGDRRGIRRL